MEAIRKYGAPGHARKAGLWGGGGGGGDGTTTSERHGHPWARRSARNASAAVVPVTGQVSRRAAGRAPPANPRRAATPHRTPRAPSSPHMGLDADLSMADPFALPQQ